MARATILKPRQLGPRADGPSFFAGRIPPVLDDSYRTLILGQHPSLYWRLGESAGTVATDLAEASRHGTYSGVAGSTYTLGKTGALSGDLDLAVALAGGYVASGYNPFVNGTARSFSMLALANSVASSQHLLLGQDGAGGLQVFGTISGGTNLYFQAATGTVYTFAGGLTYGTGVWHHLVFVVDDPGDQILLYVNGALKDTKAMTDTPWAAAGNLQLGARRGATASLPWNGSVDELAVFERALTADEVYRQWKIASTRQFPLYVGQRSGSYYDAVQALVPRLYWRLDEPSAGLSVSDSSPAGGADGGGFNGANVLHAQPGAVDGDGSTFFSDDPGVTSAKAYDFAPFKAGAKITVAGISKNAATVITGSGTFQTLFASGAGPGGINDDCTLEVNNDPAALNPPGGKVRWYANVAVDGGAVKWWDFLEAWPRNGKQWVHWVLTFDYAGQGGPRLWVNGVETVRTAGFGGGGGDFQGTEGTFQVANRGNGSYEVWEGWIDEVSAWERVLSDAEIASLWAAAAFQMMYAESSAVSSASLALSAPTRVALDPIAAQAAADLALSAPTKIDLDPIAAQASALAALSAPTGVALDPVSALSSDSLALSAPTKLTPDPVNATASPSLALSAPTAVALDPASAQSSASLALRAPTEIPLGAASALASASAALSAATTLPLGAASAVVLTSAALAAPTELPLSAASALAGATATLSAPTSLPLDPASATAAASLALSAPTEVALAPSSAVALASLALTAPTSLALAAASALASATLALSSPTELALDASLAASAATLALSSPTAIALDPVTALSLATLSLRAPTLVDLGSSDAVSASALALAAPALVALDPVTALAAATLALRAPAELDLDAASAASSASALLTADGTTYVILAPVNAQSSATVALAARVLLIASAVDAISSAQAHLSAPAMLNLAPVSVLATALASLASPAWLTPDAVVALSAASLHLQSRPLISAITTATSSASLELTRSAGLELDPINATSSALLALLQHAGAAPLAFALARVHTDVLGRLAGVRPDKVARGRASASGAGRLKGGR